MCGITGILAFNDSGRKHIHRIEKSTERLAKRGPDHQGVYKTSKIALGHRRLSIIDLSNTGNQPFVDPTGNYILSFNGEFYNYQEHRAKLIADGVEFKSTSDTEVLLYLLIREGFRALEKVNGFFALAFYNQEKDELLIARDRFGIKPLHVSIDENRILFASEIKSILAFGIEKELDFDSLFTYLQLNYIPAPNSIFKKIKKIKPGYCWEVKGNGIVNKICYYPPSNYSKKSDFSFKNASNRLRSHLETSVERRMIADVEVGAFLSGGIDSSIIASLARQINPKLRTFSMGFEGNEYFDESNHAEAMARHIGSNHTTYKINMDDLLQHMMLFLNNMDEPFADSSALAVSVLSEKTKAVSKVALSGDGADELFAGYNKHRALMLYKKYNTISSLISSGGKLIGQLPSSRKNRILNKIRQLHKFAKGADMNAADRYWFLASFQQVSDVRKTLFYQPAEEYDHRINELLRNFNADSNELEATLLTDLEMVLPDDMLTKVDRMSMQNSLEVRVPFLDHELVEFAGSLPEEYKIDSQQTKKILRSACSDLLPQEILNRPKHGFEVPLEKWFKTELSQLIESDLLSDELISDQKIFDPTTIRNLRRQLFSGLPGESSGMIYNLMVFNYWWKNNIAS